MIEVDAELDTYRGKLMGRIWHEERKAGMRKDIFYNISPGFGFFLAPLNQRRVLHVRMSLLRLYWTLQSLCIAGSGSWPL